MLSVGMRSENTYTSARSQAVPAAALRVVLIIGADRLGVHVFGAEFCDEAAEDTAASRNAEGDGLLLFMFAVLILANVLRSRSTVMYSGQCCLKSRRSPPGYF